MKTKMIWPVFCALASLLFPVFSGRAEGFVSVRSGLLLLFLLLFFTTLYKSVVCLACFVGRRKEPSRPACWEAVWYVLALILFCFSIFLGKHIDNDRIAKTKETGDVLIQKVSQFYIDNGSLPDSLEQEPFLYFMPALENSSFWIEAQQGDSFHIGFNSIGFLVCTKGNRDKDWICDD